MDCIFDTGDDMIEVLKQMQEALREYHYYTIDAGLPNQSMLNKGYAAYQAGLKAITELESQEPVAWKHDCAALLQNNIELWVDGCPHCGKPRTVHPPQRTWQGLTKEDKDLIEDLCDMMIGDAAFSTIDAILKGKNT